MTLTSREWASVFWLAVFSLFAIGVSGVRASVWQMLKILVSPKLLVSLLVLIAYTVAAVAVAKRVGIWSLIDLKDTLVWFLAVAVALFFSLSRAMDEPGFFRMAALRTVELAVVVQFFRNLQSLGLLAEIVVQVVLIVIGLMFAVTSISKDPDTARLAPFFRGVLVAAGLALLAYSLFKTLTIGEMDAGRWLRQFALPIWLTMAVLPIIYVLALFAAYEMAFMRMRFAARGASRWRGQVALLLKARLRLARVRSAKYPYLNDMAVARSVRDGMSAYDAMVTQQRAELEAERQAATRLERFAGVKGVDENGRQLDQREFEATKDALRWLAFCQMGQHRANGSYRSDQLDIMGGFSGLPDNHGIVMRVSRNGQAWWAWRTTPSDWVLGIGANSGPPDQWFYEGIEAPTSSPGESPWRQLMQAQGSASHWD